MSDDNLIRSDSPHQVTMAEGTHVAVGKKADAGQPSVRKVLAEPDGIVIEHSLKDNLVQLPEVAAVPSPAQGPVVERSESDRFVEVPTVAPETFLQPNEPMPAWALEKPEAMLTGAAGAEPPASSDAMEMMKQMDFPARVVKLKIENDKVRTKLDGLQFSMRN